MPVFYYYLFKQLLAASPCCRAQGSLQYKLLNQASLLISSDLFTSMTEQNVNLCNAIIWHNCCSQVLDTLWWYGNGISFSKIHFFRYSHWFLLFCFSLSKETILFISLWFFFVVFLCTSASPFLNFIPWSLFFLCGGNVAYYMVVL